MSTPVIVSRIQNRRGTQAQFDGLVFNPAGPNSVYPHGYTGIGGYGSFPDFNSVNYPNVLLPGELALCTDTRKIFLGNTGGEFIELAGVSLDGEFLDPSTWILPPSGSFVPVTKVIPGPTTVTLEYDSTAFFTILYDATDAIAPGPNALGTEFSRNGVLQITAIVPPLVPPVIPLPFPPFNPVSITDTGTEISLMPIFSLSFNAFYNGSKIEVWYKHDFPTDIIFNTNTVTWLPL